MKRLQTCLMHKACRIRGSTRTLVDPPLCSVLYGGMPRREQAASLNHLRPQLVVATPGRLLDLVHTGELPLHQVCANCWPKLQTASCKHCKLLVLDHDPC